MLSGILFSQILSLCEPYQRRAGLRIWTLQELFTHSHTTTVAALITAMCAVYHLLVRDAAQAPQSQRSSALPLMQGALHSSIVRLRGQTIQARSRLQSNLC